VAPGAVGIEERARIACIEAVRQDKRDDKRADE
jgi:hypothetical protein